MIDNTKLPINKLIAKLNEAAENNQALTLTPDEVKLAAKKFGKLRMVPVFKMGEIPDEYLNHNRKLHDDSKE